MSTEEIVQRTRLLDSEIKVTFILRFTCSVQMIVFSVFLQLCASLWCLRYQIMKSEVLRVTHELQAMKDKIKENTEKIKVNKTLPYLVSNVIEVRWHLDVSFKVLEWDIRSFLSASSMCMGFKVCMCCVFEWKLLDVDPNDQEEDGANIDLDSQRKGKCAVIKTSTRQVSQLCNFYSFSIVIVWPLCFSFLHHKHFPLCFSF